MSNSDREREIRDRQAIDSARELIRVAEQKVAEGDKPAAREAADKAVRTLAAFTLEYVG